MPSSAAAQQSSPAACVSASPGQATITSTAASCELDWAGLRPWKPWAAIGLGELVTDEESSRTRYVGLGFHDLRRANATGRVAEGVEIMEPAPEGWKEPGGGDA
jgi:hypothetical protein